MLEGRGLALEGRDRRVAPARVDVRLLLAGEDRRAVLRRAQVVRRGQVQRRHQRSRRLVGRLAGVNGGGVHAQAAVVVGHRGVLRSRGSSPMACESSTDAGMLMRDGPDRCRRHVRRLPGARLAGRPQGEGGFGRGPHRRRPRDAPVARHAHHDGHVGGRRVSARHGGRRLQVEPRPRPAGRAVLRHQPDPGRPLLRQAHAVLRVHHPRRSVRGEIRAQVGGRAVGAGHGGRGVLERRAARGPRLHVRRAARRRPHDGHPRLGPGRDRVHDGRRHVVGGLHRCAAARTGRRRPGRGAAVRARCRGRAGRRMAALRDRAGGSGRPAAAARRAWRLLDAGVAGRDGGTSA